MRRKEKQIFDEELLTTILKEASVCRIGMSQDNVPYVVPMNFGYENGTIYLHSAKEGKKISILQDNPLVCFEVEHKVEIIPSEVACNWGMKYLSIIGWGKAEVVEDSHEIEAALNIILRKYSDTVTYTYSEKSVSNVLIIKVKISEMTGKKSGY